MLAKTDDNQIDGWRHKDPPSTVRVKSRDELEKANEIRDRWERRRAIRRLAPSIAEITVSVYTDPELVPTKYVEVDATGNFNLLKPGYYETGRGIDLDGYEEPSEDEWGKII